MSSLDEINGDKTVDDSIEISTNAESNDSGILDQSSLLDVSQSASIRSSRRKMKSGSAVVLNTNRLQKYIQKDTVEESIPENGISQILDFKEQYLQKMAPNKATTDPRLIEFKRKVVMVKLQRWWRKRVEQRELNYVQQGAWKLHTSDKVFALFLGYRVRKLMRSPGLIANVKAQQDVHRILADMCSTIIALGSYTTSGDKWEKFRQELETNSVDNLLLRYPTLTHTDMILAKSMSRQLLMERQKLHLLVFGGCKWLQFPSPGYWDLGAALRTARASSQRHHAHGHSNTDSPSRKPLNKSNMETPPNVRRAVKISSATAKPVPGELNLHKNNSHLVEDRGSVFSTPPAGMQERPIQSRGSQDEGVFISRLRHSGDRPERVVDPHLLMLTPEAEQAPHVPRVQREPREPRDSHEKVRTIRAPVVQASTSASTHAAHPTHAHHVHSKSLGNLSSGQKNKTDAAAVSQANSHSERRRDSSKGHLQLHILSGEKLLAARKGAAVRDSVGGAVPDRIPCLKVRLMLPNWTGSGTRGAPSPDPVGAQGLKKVNEQLRDFTVTTLNPQWNAHFTLNFPCPRAVVQTLASELRVSPYDNDGLLTDAAFESIRRSLLQWWSLGVVNIEVVDGERFNQEIFMGQFDLLLNGFMVLIKKPDDLEIKGNFQLCKAKPTDRVSGSIKIQSYLHPPEKSYIAELLEASLRVSQSQAPAHFDKASSEEVSHAASDLNENVTRFGARSPPMGRKGEGEEHSTSTSSTNSPPEAPSASGAVYSSRFMQTLLRYSKQHGAVFDPTAPPPPPTSNVSHREVSSHEKAAPSSQAVRTGGFASNFAQETDGSEHFLRDPQLEESDNIRFNVQSGRVANQMDISESARLLKEKLRRGRPNPRKAPAPPPPPTQQQEVDALEQKVVIPQYQAPEHAHHRSQSTSAVPSSASRLPHQQESVRGMGGVGGSKSMKASKEQSSVDASALRRVSMVDVSKRLAGLSALQYSTDAVLDNLNIKLEAKLRVRDSVSGTHSDDRPSPQKVSHHHTPARVESVPARSPHKDTIVVQLDLSIDQEEPEEVLNMPNTAEIRHAMLNASFRSSREEEEDAPEMGAETDDSDSEHSKQQHFRDPHDSDSSFQDAYDLEGADFNDEFGQNEDDEEEEDGRGYERQFLDRQQAFASDDYSFSEGGFGGEHSEVPVMTAQRRHAHPSAQLAVRPVTQTRSEDVDTIYLEEEEEEHGDFGDDESFNSDVDRTKAAVYNNSTLSSEYSVNVQEFLSPDPRHTPRRGSGAAHSNSKASDYLNRDSDDELIVMDNYEDYGSPTDGRTVLKGQSPLSPGLFEVRSVQNLLSSSDSVGDAQLSHQTKSPSRSLFGVQRHDEIPTKPGSFSSPQREHHSAQKRQVSGHKEVLSPRREQIRRVVLELDDLEL